MRPASVPTPSSFATALLPDDPEQRVQQWEQHNAQSLIALSCTPAQGGSFDAVEVNLQLEQVHLARVRGTGHRVARTAAAIEVTPAGAIAVYATLRGEALLEYDGHRRLLRPGQLLVCDADRPFVRGFGHGLDEFAVKVPQARFADLTGLSAVDTPIVVDAAGNAHGRALARLVGRALRADHPAPADEQAVIELVSLLATDGRLAMPVAHRAAARAFIEENLTDPGLTASDVAAGIGISERTLSRVFASIGTTVPRHILGRRLDAAYSLLSTSHDAGLRTVDVAARCGFSSPSYFAQAFQRRFGVRAGEVRRAAG